MQGTRLWRQQILFYSIHRAECCSTRERSWFFFSSSKAQLPNGRKAGQRKKRDLWAGGPRVREVRCSLFLLTFLFVDLHIASRQRKNGSPPVREQGGPGVERPKKNGPACPCGQGDQQSFSMFFFLFHFVWTWNFFLQLRSFSQGKKSLPAQRAGGTSSKRTTLTTNPNNARSRALRPHRPRDACPSYEDKSHSR